MRTKFLIINIAIFAILILPIQIKALDSGGSFPTVILGKWTETYVDANGIQHGNCLGTEYKYCRSCNCLTDNTLSNQDHVSVFFHSQTNPENGNGYTNVVLTVFVNPSNGSVDQSVTHVYPNNQIISTYSAWLTATGLTRLP